MANDNNDTYIVCWMTTLEKPNKEGETHIDHYKVFIDEDSNVDAAQGFYSQLLDNKNVYSANICKVIKSTDY